MGWRSVVPEGIHPSVSVEPFLWLALVTVGAQIWVGDIGMDTLRPLDEFYHITGERPNDRVTTILKLHATGWAHSATRNAALDLLCRRQVVH